MRDFFKSTAIGEACMCRCICGVLKEKLVVLVTHQVHFALSADKILVLKEVSLLIGQLNS